MKPPLLTPRVTMPLIPAGSSVLCALSGGADSVCLLHLLAQRQDITLAAAHFNHCLRGDGSDGDEAFVRDLCDRLRIPLTVGCGDVSSFAQENGLSVEEAARILRYRFLEETAVQRGCGLIATAHNAEDNAETVLWNLIRGAGLTGLSGIPPQRDKLVRPLLSVSRQDISAYLLQNELPHREDPTNAETVYTRNRLRHQVLPLLRELNPRAVEHIGQTAARLRELDDTLSQALAPYRAACTRERGLIALPAAALAELSPQLRAKLLLSLADELGVGRKDLGAVHLEAIAALTEGGELHLPHGLTVLREYDTLIFTTLPPPAPLTAFCPQRGENRVSGTDWTVSLAEEPWEGLTVRARQRGDELTLPNGHTRSLKRLFIDRKIPRRERERIPVVADRDGVLAVAGIGGNLSHPRQEAIKIIQTERGERV